MMQVLYTLLRLRRHGLYTEVKCVAYLHTTGTSRHTHISNKSLLLCYVLKIQARHCTSSVLSAGPMQDASFSLNLHLRRKTISTILVFYTYMFITYICHHFGSPANTVTLTHHCNAATRCRLGLMRDASARTFM